MKKIYFLLMALCVTFMANAQTDKTWIFSDQAFVDLGSPFNTEDLITIDGLNIVSGGKDMKVNSNSKDFDEDGDGVNEYEFTYRFQLNGTGKWTDATTIESRVIYFEVTGPCNISLYGVTGKDTYERSMIISEGSQTNELGRLVSSDASTVLKKTVAYTGTETTNIYMWSADSGFNIYMIELEYTSEDDVTTSVGDITDTKEVVKTEYYGINGSLVSTRFEGLPKGLYIKKVTYDNGSVETTKIVKSTY